MPPWLLFLQNVYQTSSPEEDAKKNSSQLEALVKEPMEELQTTVQQLGTGVEKRLPPQEKLEQRGDPFRSVFDQSTGGMVIMDQYFRFQWVNPAFCQIFGYTAAECSSLTLADIVHPDDLPKYPEEMRRLLVGEIDRFQLEKRLIRKDGSVFWVDLCISLLMAIERQPVCFLANIQDITVRRERENSLAQQMALLQDLYNHAPCGYHSLDHEGTFVEINDTEMAWLGYTREEVAGQMKFSDILSPKSQKIFQNNFPTLRDRGSVRNLKLDLIRKDGTTLPIILKKISTNGDVGNSPVSRFVIFDITERRLAEKALGGSERRIRQLASQLITAQEDERHRISLDLHDGLGQLLTILKMNLSLLQRKIAAETLSHQEKFDESLGLVDQIVYHVRHLSQKLNPAILKEIGLKLALHELFEEFEKYHNIKVLAEIDNIDNTYPMMAQITIYRLFQECLQNICKHSEATTVKAVVKKDLWKVTCIIVDNGQGFDLNEVRKRKGPARGMGLTAMAERVRCLGGSFEVSCKRGIGTKVTFMVPSKYLQERKIAEQHSPAGGEG